MAILIDSSILIAYERGRLDFAAEAARRGDPDAFLSVITASELLHGTHRVVDAGMRARRQVFVEGLLARFPLIEIDLQIARAHAALWSTLAQQGQMIGMNDSWIAASCIVRDLTLVTANGKEFGRVPGLRVENWNAPAS